ncbi:MAG TPA: hypothetical protein VEJ67_11410 [Candidatus Cybelea sp.]|nr:hypothetical protein [Candidatus Cybelea sp.]
MNEGSHFGQARVCELLRGKAHRVTFHLRNPSVCAAMAVLLALLPHSLSVPPLAARPPQTQDQQAAQQLVRDMVQSELEAQNDDHTNWRYHEVQVVHGVSRLLDVYQTKYGEIQRVLEIDGKPLAPTQLRTEDARIQKIVDHPGSMRSAGKERQQDANEEQKLLKMLPDAFLYHSEGQEGTSIKLSFVPDPSFRASDHESEVFHHMEGSLLVDARSKRLVEISGRLISPVKFGYGLLGHLDAGGTFHVEERDVGGGHWEMVALHVDMNGKALFFKTIAVHEDETYSDFHEVSGDATLAEAAQQLKRDVDALASPSGT